MALKDWRKISGGPKGNLYFENGRSEVRIIKHTNLIDIRYDGKFGVEIFVPSKNLKAINHKFKTKSQALKFAMDYMRKH